MRTDAISGAPARPPLATALSDWMRRVLARRPAAARADDGLVYRLRHWPQLSPVQRTADVLRLLSLMSNRPVNRAWILSHTRLTVERVDQLIDLLVLQDAVEIIDTRAFAR